MALLIEQLLLFVDFQILAIPPASLSVTTHWLRKAPLLLCALDFGALSLHRRFQTALSATFLVPRLVTAFAVVFLLSLLTFWSEQDNLLEQGSLEESGFNELGLQAVGLEQQRLGGFRVQTGHQALIWAIVSTWSFGVQDLSAPASSGALSLSTQQLAGWRTPT